MIQGLRCPEPMPTIRWRPLICVTMALALFGLTIDRFGFLPAATLLIVVSALGERGRDLRRILILALIVVPAFYAIFVVALGIPVAPVRWSM